MRIAFVEDLFVSVVWNNLCQNWRDGEAKSPYFDVPIRASDPA